MLDFVRLRSHQMHKFKPKIAIHSDKGPFLVKTASTRDEILAAMRLRYQVFRREMLGRGRKPGLDIDAFDFASDHLIIIEKKSHQVVGTYRLKCSRYSDQFALTKKFHLARVLEVPGPHLELGRACIHQDFRKDLVIALLWRGIAEYMSATGSQILFGCASFSTESPRQAALLYNRFSREGRIQPSLSCPPTVTFSMPNLGLWIERLNRPFTAEETSEVEGLISALSRSDLKVGVFLGGEPAWDAEFKRIDFLTILPRENLNRILWRKFTACPENSVATSPDDSRFAMSPRCAIS